MADKRLRKSVPLKIFVHITMFIAFLCIAATIILGVVYWNLRYDTYYMFKGGDDKYFNSAVFAKEYEEMLYNLSIAIANEEYYLTGNNNFKFAVYNKDGEVLNSSDDWDEELFEEASIYYYTIDYRQLNLLDVKEIDYASYTSSEYSSISEAEVEVANERGITIYSSNFMKEKLSGAFSDLSPENVGYVATYVPDVLTPGDTFYETWQTFSQWHTAFMVMLVMSIIGVIIFIIGFIYAVLAAGWSHREKGICLNWFDRIFTEVSVTMIVLCLAVILSGGAMELSYDVTNIIEMRPGPSVLINLIWIALAYIVGMFGFYSVVRRVKAGTILKNTIVFQLLHRIFEVIYKGFINNNLIRKYIAVIFGLGILDLFLMYAAINSGSFSWWTFTICIYIYEFLYIGKKLLVIQKIAEGAKTIASGELEYKIETQGMSGTFLEFAENINNIGQGLNLAIDESVKSERMKADLITNVSHDIKTPLTSIINYVDLLKRENITREPMREYIEILDTKSQRLGELVEDLIEASRVTSGNVTLEKTEIDFVELVRQVAGAFDKKFKEKKLEFMMAQYDEPMLIYVDGRRLYRVLENLFTNASKYALEGTRVYVDMFMKDGWACMAMKNISREALNISPEELTMRFVRGDSSRTTEGSGLGLSIAKSLTELHGGKFNIYLDGDLFKVNICMTLMPKPGK